MKFKNTTSQYGVNAKLLHWSLAILMLGLVALGWYMVGLNYYHKWYQSSLSLHKALGVVAFVLGVVNIVWAWYSPWPKLSSALSAGNRLAARWMHGLLIVLTLFIPVSGYLISTAAGDGIDLFGLATLPALWPVGSQAQPLMEQLHYYSGYGLLGLVAVHAGAALKHQFIDKDGTLRRML